MLNKEKTISDIKDLAKKLVSILPEDIGAAREDVEAKFSRAIQISLEKMNIVSREEFDVYAALLEKTQKKLEELEKKIEVAK